MTTTATKIDALAVLRSHPQWVVYCLEPYKKDATRLTKVPYNAKNGYKASSTNPKTWATYDQAVKAHKHSKNVDGKPFDGIGFVFNRDITGVDCDHCIDANGNIDIWAQAVIDQCDSYAEISPSGEGVHILLFGLVPLNNETNKHAGRKIALPGMRHPKAAIEMYSEGRFFTVTEKHLSGTPTTIEDRLEQLLAIHAHFYAPKPKGKESASSRIPDNALSLSDDELIAKACQAKGGQTFDALWRGNISGYPSQSEADLAFCNKLAFWTRKDKVRMRSLFESSGLHREKWDNHPTYADDTLDKAIDACTEVYTPSTLLPAHTMSNGAGAGKNTSYVATAEGDNLPQVILSGQLRDKWNIALGRLREAEEKNRHIFVQSARLVQIGQDDRKRPIIMPIGIAELKNALSRSADYYRLKEKETGDELIPISPPKEIAESILALVPNEWKFPSLEAIVETPVMRPDGSILDTPGYDAATRLYYIPQDGLKFQKVPLQPTQEEIEQAVALLEEALGEFPYVSDADKANAYAAEMTPILRPAIKRHIPLGLIDAPKPGTGKGLLADTIALTATGKTASILTAPDSEDEWDKRITALLMQGRSIVCIDNITGTLQSAALDATLTADEKEGRILGISKMGQFPNRATWLATGNNIKLGGDLPRRCYRIRLDPHVSRPWMRTGFKHEDLATWVTEHRGELITAILTLARAWYVAGQPLDGTVPALGTFTDWAKMLGGILKLAGVCGFLSNLEILYEEADEYSTQWEAFLYAWHDIFGQEWKTTSEIVKELTPIADSDEKIADSALALALPEDLQEALKEKPKSFSIILGKALARLLEACFGEHNLRIERDKDKNTKAKKWRVVSNFADSADSVTTHARSEKEHDKSLTSNTIKSNRENEVKHYPHYPQNGLTALDESGIESPEKPLNELTAQKSAKTALSAPPPDCQCGNPNWQSVYDKTLKIQVWKCKTCDAAPAR